ncbi:hypothetical protein ABPG72_022657 [Tetrahymena utriculariae]
MDKIWTKFKKLLSFDNKENQQTTQCDICIKFFVKESGQTIHINNKQVEIYYPKDVKQPKFVVFLQRPNIFQKQILHGKHISGTDLVAIILIDLRMVLLDYKRGNVLKIVKNVNQIEKLNTNCLLLFGTNQARTICRRTFKVIHQVRTSFSSPVFTLDVQKDLFVIGSYWDIYVYNHNLQQKASQIRAHSMNVLCVKFINQNSIASTSEDYYLNIWEIQQQIIEGVEKYELVKKFAVYMSYIAASCIIPCPYNNFSIMANSNSYVRYIVFNQQINGQNPIDYDSLQCSISNLKMDKMFDFEKQFNIKQLNIDVKNSQMIAYFKDSCNFFSFYFNKSAFSNITFNQN